MEVGSSKAHFGCILIRSQIAEPGNLPKSFLNGRIDLSQAEAVIDIIRAKTDRALLMANKQLSGGLSNKIKRYVQIC